MNETNLKASLLIEELHDFNLGPRADLQVKIKQQGDIKSGILDYGTVTNRFGVTFEGFIASV